MPETPPEQHKKTAPKSVRCAVLTMSDSRTEETDDSGKLIKELLRNAGHEIVGYQIVKDDKRDIKDALKAFAKRDDVDAILTNGGTGISMRDSTYEVVEDFLDKTIDGFGELFRALSYQEIGSAAMMSRAIAGVGKGTVVISMPGSPGGVRLAMEKLVLPELGHLVGLVQRHREKQRELEGHKKHKRHEVKGKWEKDDAHEDDENRRI
jgi:molybdenum cofactor biosynthesis protein B